MKRSLALAAAALAAVTLVAAGCGGSDEVPADAVAVVDGTPITRSSLDGLLARAKKSYAAQKRDFPKAGTSDYQSLQTQAVAYLVQREEYAREADKLGIDVTDQQIAKKVEEVKKQYFGGSQAKFEKGLADQGYTKASLEDDIRSQLLTEGIYKKVTTDAKVTDADVKSYYEKNRANYSVPESRSVRHILVKIEGRRRPDPHRARQRRRLRRARQGELDRPRLEGRGRQAHRLQGPDRRPVRQGCVLARHQRALAAGQDAVRLPPDPAARGRQGRLGHPVRPGQGPDPTQLESETKNTAVNKWVSDVEKEYKDKVQYAAGFEPPDTSTTTGETTTTSG